MGGQDSPKVADVEFADADSDDVAVVVELGDAGLAAVAVLGPVGLSGLTRLAKPSFGELEGEDEGAEVGVSDVGGGDLERLVLVGHPDVLVHLYAFPVLRQHLHFEFGGHLAAGTRTAGAGEGADGSLGEAADLPGNDRLIISW